MTSAAVVAVILLVPIVSPTPLLINMSNSGQMKQQSQSNGIGNQILATQQHIHSETVTQTGLQMIHYNIITQTLMDSFVQMAYAAGTFRHFTLVASEGVTNLPTGDKIAIFTFNGTIPSPTIRVTQGDVVTVTVVNPADNSDIHSVDFHGSQLSAVPNFAAVPPGQSRTLTFVAVNPGVWAYHCEANNVFELWEHPMKGMAGMMIIDPKPGYSGFTTNNGITGNNQHVQPLAIEFSLVYGEWYADDATTTLPTSTTGNTTNTPLVSAHDFDQGKMFHEIPTYAHVNGVPFGYTGPLMQLPPWNSSNLRDVINVDFLPDNPNPPLSALTTPDGNGHTAATHLNVKTGDHVRFFIQNVGDKAVAWHIVGEQLDRVSVGGSIVAKGVQTWNIPAYGDATVDVVFEQPGVYAAVNHDYSLFFKGQAIIIVVSDSGGSNPSNAIPPPSASPGTSISQITCNYGIGPDKVISSDDNQFVSKCGT